MLHLRRVNREQRLGDDAVTKSEGAREVQRHRAAGVYGRLGGPPKRSSTTAIRMNPTSTKRQMLAARVSVWSMVNYVLALILRNLCSVASYSVARLAPPGHSQLAVQALLLSLPLASRGLCFGDAGKHRSEILVSAVRVQPV